MKQIILPVTVHLNIRLPLPSCSRNRQTRLPARSRRPMPARAVATAAGVGSASMKKSKPEPILVMDYRSTAERGGWYMSAATMTVATVSRWTMGRRCVCVQSISYSLLCRWFRAAVLRWTGNWKRPCSTAWTPNGAPSAGRCSPPAPTGLNTARNVPDA